MRKKHVDREVRFVVCIVDSEPDLERRKVYQVLPDESAARDHDIRVIDESGEEITYARRAILWQLNCRKRQKNR
ncbi:MAG: hypothetical protein ACE5HO_10650 [bacterium]